MTMTLMDPKLIAEIAQREWGKLVVGPGPAEIAVRLARLEMARKLSLALTPLGTGGDFDLRQQSRLLAIDETVEVLALLGGPAAGDRWLAFAEPQEEGGAPARAIPLIDTRANDVDRAALNVAHMVNEIRGEAIFRTVDGGPAVCLPKDAWEFVQDALKKWDAATQALLASPMAESEKTS